MVQQISVEGNGDKRMLEILVTEMELNQLPSHCMLWIVEDTDYSIFVKQSFCSSKSGLLF